MQKTSEIEAFERLETRGRPVKKVFHIEPGGLLRVKKSEKSAVVRCARKNGWKIRTKSIDGRVVVYRES